MRAVRVTIFIVLSVASLLSPSLLFASGACCTISLGESDRPTLTLVGSTGWSHEKIGGVSYDLRQHALILKGSLPIEGIILVSAQLGVPLQTRLVSTGESRKGSSGYLYGIGLGYTIPDLLPSLNLHFSLNYARSIGRLERNHQSSISSSFVISEIQAIPIAEYQFTKETAAYGGVRLYSGRNQIRDEGALLAGEREGSISPFFGIRQSLWDGVSLVAEGSLGHTRIVSLAVTLSM
jgi:hypothetical protein